MYNIYLSSLLILYTLKCLCFFTFYIYALPYTSFNICLFHVALVHVIFGIFGLLFQAFRRFWLSLLFFQKGKLQQKVSRESRILKWHKIQKKYVFFLWRESECRPSAPVVSKQKGCRENKGKRILIINMIMIPTRRCWQWADQEYCSLLFLHLMIYFYFFVKTHHRTDLMYIAYLFQKRWRYRGGTILVKGRWCAETVRNHTRK